MPVIGSPFAFSVAENIAASLLLEADVAVSWSVTGGTLAGSASIVDNELTLAAQNYESVTSGTVQVRAMHATGGFADQTITFTILNAVVALGNAGTVNQNSAGTTLTQSVVVASGANRILLVAHEIALNETISGVTYAGLPMTLVKSKLTTESSSHTLVELWELRDPPVGTANAVVTRVGTTSARWYGAAKVLYNIASDAAVTADYTAIADATSYTATGPTTPGDDYFTVGAFGFFHSDSTLITHDVPAGAEFNASNWPTGAQSSMLLFGLTHLTAGATSYMTGVNASGSSVSAGQRVAGVFASYRLIPYQAELPVYYVKNGGNDTNSGLSDALAWGSLDPVDAILSAGAEAGTIINLNGGERHRRATAPLSTADYLLDVNSLGQAASLVAIQAYGAGRAVLAGDTVYATGWSAPTSGETNANFASLSKRSFAGDALSRKNFPLYGGNMMHPAQWAKDVDPSTNSPQRYQLSDVGSANWHHPPTGDMQANMNTPASSTYDPTKAVRYALVSGTAGTASARYRLEIEYAAIAARYPSVDQLVGYWLVFRQGTTNLTTELVISDYDNTTGKITCYSADAEKAESLYAHFHDTEFYWAVRYHPRDIEQVGVYGIAANGETLYGWFGAGDKSVARYPFGVLLQGTYASLQVDVEGLCEPAASGNGGAVMINGNDMTIGSASAPVTLRRNKSYLAVGSSGVVGRKRANVWLVLDEMYEMSGLRLATLQDSTVHYARAGHSALGGSAAYRIGHASNGSEPKNNLFTNMIFPQHKARHGNGLTAYGSVHDEIAKAVVITGCTTPATSQSTPPGGVDKAEEYRQLFLTGRRSIAAAGAATWGDTTPILRHDTYEKGSRWDQVMAFHGASSGWSLADSAAGNGAILERSVVQSLGLGTGAGAGLTMQDVLSLAESAYHGDEAWMANASSGLPTVTRTTWATAVEVAAGENFNNGVITTRMHEVLSRRYSAEDAGDFAPGAPLYDPVVLFTELDGWTWTLPAYGAAFAMQALRFDSTPSGGGAARWHKNTQAGDSLATVIGWRPGSTLSLPAGVTDNDLFFIERGVICPVARLTQTSGSITVRETNPAATDVADFKDTVLTWVTF